MKGEKGPSAPSANLYVADLPGDIDDATIQSVFGAYGTIIQHKILAKPNPMVPTACALIRFSTVEEAKWIVENVNNNIPQGLSTPIKVNYNASPDKGSGKGKDFGSKGGVFSSSPFGKGYGKAPLMAGLVSSPYGSPWQGGKPSFGIRGLIKGLLEAQALPGSEIISNDQNALYVHGLPSDTQDADLYKIFAPFGAIAPRGVRAMLYPDGTCMGFGFINYVEPHPIEAAISTLNGTQMPDGKTLTVKVKDQKGSTSME